MKQKKLAITLAAAIMLSSFSGISPFATVLNAAAEEATTNKTEETKELTVPQNVRVENGFLKWDEVEGAYGYNVSTTDRDGNEISVVYYEMSVELNRFFYNQIQYGHFMDFGEHKFNVRAFDESGILTECSETVTASYAPSFEIPTNVRLSEDGETFLWDEVSKAKRYNIVFFKNDENHTFYSSNYLNYNSLTFKHYLGEKGDYLFSVQAMDGDYNVSEWTEPIAFTYDVAELGVPKNVRLDESGENILWDAVEGAVSYDVQIWSSVNHGDGSGSGHTYGNNTNETHFDNWKFYTCPFAFESREIRVCAYDSEGNSSQYSDSLYVSFDMTIDKSLALPNNIVFDGITMRWDNNFIDGAKYWACILSDEDILVHEWYSTEPEVGIVCPNNKFPAGSYDVELYVVSQDNKYNYKTYTYTSEAVHDEAVWIPKLYYKFETILWDWDRLRQEDTSNFWLRIKKNDTVIKLTNTYGAAYYGLSELIDGDYTVDVCAYEYTDKLGPWSEPLNIKKHGEGLFDKENEVTESVEAPPEAADIPEEDRITSITINPAFNMKDKHDNNVELDLSKIKIKAKEIYDEEGLKRASEALGEELKGNKHYNLLDLTLLYNGEDYSNGYEGLVQVIIPIPKGHRDKTFSCYRLTEVDGKMVKELIDGEQTEDSYIIYLEHFSEYALVGAGEDNDEPGTTTPSASFYKIDLKTDGNGKASANVKNPEEVEAGTDVTLTATPNSGYKFSKWTVVKGDVTIKDNKFTMPESDVEIKAEFTKTSSGSGSGSSGGSSGGSRRPSSSSSAAETVTVNGKSGSWSDVISTIDSAANYGVITISGNTNIPADVISAAAKKNIRLEVQGNDTCTWVIDAGMVGETFKYLSITDETITSVNKTIKSGEVSRDFRVTESKLGTGASIRYNAGASNSGKFANLFRVNGTTLEFVGVVKVDTAGNALLPITAAGAYKIVISDETKLVGDINNSMEINALDAAAMLKKLVMNEVTAEEAAKFDFNGDGKTNALDAAAILKCIVNS